MTRRAHKIDRDQPEIVDALVNHGAKVLSLARYGLSVDLLVQFRGRLYLLEVKNHDDPPSARRLTNRELDVARNFPVIVVWTPEMAIDAIEGRLSPVSCVA